MTRFILALFVAVASLSSLTTCKHTCEDAGCPANQHCVDQLCRCKKGFSGDECFLEDKCISREIDCGPKLCKEGQCVCPFWWMGDDCGRFNPEDFFGRFEVSTFETSDPEFNVLDEAKEINLIELDSFRGNEYVKGEVADKDSIQQFVAYNQVTIRFNWHGPISFGLTFPPDSAIGVGGQDQIKLSGIVELLDDGNWNVLGTLEWQEWGEWRSGARDHVSWHTRRSAYVKGLFTRISE